ncbi:MAG: hypothetical protein ABIJ35_07845 [Acidobacteriota bacterium]
MIPKQTLWEEFLKDSATFWKEFIMDCSRSISEMQQLKGKILKDYLFSDPDEREEILLLIDHIIFEESHAATTGREERQKNILAITSLTKSIQEREAGSPPVSGGGQSSLFG